jgi:hypothetical protein
MGSLGWKLRRLRAMSAREVATRLVRAVRERVSPLPKEPPDATWRRHYVPYAPLPTVRRLAELLALCPQAVSAAEQERLVEEADALQRGVWTLFGYPVQLDDPPCWQRNYLLGKDWADAPAKAIDYRRIDIAGGVKYVWELSRGQPMVRLAQGYALTGEAGYAETCRRWLLDWIARNPRGWGIHWTSALEHAIRVFAWGYALALIADRLSDAEAQTVLGALVQHGEFIERHMSPGSSANNHLIGEATALAFLGRVLPDARSRRAGAGSATRRWSARRCASSTPTASTRSRRSATCRSCGSSTCTLIACSRCPTLCASGWRKASSSCGM